MKHPTTLQAEYRRGMEAARSVMTVETAEITDPEALAILARAFAALNREISQVKGKVVGGDRIDYLQIAQIRARAAGNAGGSASVRTPLGDLVCMTWLADGVRRTSQYTLAGEEITVREIKALGLSQRPTSRNRKRKAER